MEVSDILKNVAIADYLSSFESLDLFDLFALLQDPVERRQASQQEGILTIEYGEEERKPH